MKKTVLIILFSFFYSFLFSNYNKKISEYNLYVGNPKDLVTSPEFTTYELITPLFTDYAYKHRAIFIPEGEKIIYKEKEVLEFPIGTIISKTFYYPSDFNKSNSDINLMETRILIHENSGWVALPYIWDEEQKEAYLEITGGNKNAFWIDKNNNYQSIDYIIPNMNQCKGCHVNSGFLKPIGPTARQLNRNDNKNKNQLLFWQELGIIKNLPDYDLIPKIAKWNDSKLYNVNDRARAWLDINCAHCHNVNGPANNTGLFLDFYETNLKSLGVYKTPVAAGRGSGHLKYDIVPGKPDESILVYRFESTDPGIMMPELGRSMVHREGLDLIKEWIQNLD